MRHARTLGGLLGLGLLCVGMVIQADEAENRLRIEGEAIFQRGDADGDGTMSRQEFNDLAAYAPRLRGNPALIEQAFQRIDTNSDGSLSLDEYLPVHARQQAAIAGAAKRENPAAKVEPTRPTAVDAPITPEQLAFFETKVRPALVAHCYKCHSSSAEKIKGGLVLDTREGTRRGGDTGAAVVPGNLDESLLIQAIRYKDEDFQMPPKEALPQPVIADLERWVAMGAPDPRVGNGTAAVASKGVDVEKGRQFWAFQPPRKAAPPRVRDAAWARSDIDRFLLARLEAEGLKPVDDADRHTLLRRLSFDLTGLPPTPEEIATFVDDRSPAAVATVVDRLLASPLFGERWGRHWLDVARFAESSGKQVNYNYPHAWRYRDYVIAAFNADKPYDVFVKEQVAGDLLPAADPVRQAEQVIATGFLAIGAKPHVERNVIQFQMDLVDEQIDATTQAFLGLTVACARCHDHKFDPIPTRDYYAMTGIFRSTETCYGTIRIVQNNNPARLIPLAKESGQPSALEPLTEANRGQLQDQIDALLKARTQFQKDGNLLLTRPGILTSIRLAMLQSRLASYEADGTPRLFAMGVRDRPRPVDSAVLQRGEIDKPGEIVPRGVVQVLSRNSPNVAQGSGRLELAEWLSTAENPLTARVMVNRVWLHLFGRGLVPTPDNFGAAGLPPTHPELLDTLAVTFMENGWSIKSLIREVVLSRAYQLGSRFDARNNEADPDNALVWRMSKRRLEGESVRDAMLAISGQLDRNTPGGSSVARSGEGYSNFAQQAAAVDVGQSGRSVYLPVLRNNFLDALALFDFPDPSLIVSERATTTVPAQGLYLLNNPFVIRQAEVAADRLLAGKLDCDCDCERVRQAYLRVFGREPSEREEAAAEAFLASYATESPGAARTAATAPRQAWAAFYQALFASAEFLYRS